MLPAALLLIVSILIFGSSARIGAAGVALGFLTFSALLAYLAGFAALNPV